MKTPKRLTTLVEEGLVDEVIGQLMSGKEATVYIVRCGEHIRCAKVYKDAKQRSFRKATSYQEGRKAKNSRQARAMEKGSRYGRQMQEDVWQNAEVHADGNVAPRLNDVALSEEVALEYHTLLVNQMVRMLCAEVIHGDLSEYNILVAEDGPVIIDLPQAIDAVANSTAAEMLERDANNLRTYFSAFAPSLKNSRFGKEIWKLYESGALHPDQALTGQVVLDEHLAGINAVLVQVELAIKEDEIRHMCQ